MIPSEFEYYRAGSIKEALELLTDKGPDVKLLAGGHSLIPAMKLRFNSPATLVDIGHIPDISYIRQEEGHIHIGAGTTHGELASAQLIADTIPMLAETASSIGDVQVRNKGTIGGSIAHADPAADWPAALLAADATIAIEDISGTRNVLAVDYFKGLFTTDLGDNEIIKEISVPVPAQNTRSTYLKFKQPASRFAIVGCAVMVTVNDGTCEQVKVAFTGVSATPFRDRGLEQLIEGTEVDQDSLADACKSAASGIDVMSDHFASQEYRRHLAGVYAKRALITLTR